jgi:hypothetical protein
MSASSSSISVNRTQDESIILRYSDTVSILHDEMMRIARIVKRTADEIGEDVSIMSRQNEQAAVSAPPNR